MGEASRQPESGDSKANFWIVVLGGGVLALVVGLFTSAFDMAGVIDMAMAYLLMAIGWSIAVIYVCLVGYIQFREYPFKFSLISVVIVTVVSGGLCFWMVRKRAELDMAMNLESRIESQLAVDGIDDPLAFISKTKQPYKPKVKRFARIRVTNIGKKSSSNIKAIATKVGNRDGRWPLPISSLDTLFIVLNSSPVVESVKLNPGEDKDFDALVECNGEIGCPEGQLAIPFVEKGKIWFTTYFENKAASKPDSLTIKIFSEGRNALTRSFIVSQGTKGQLVLNPKSDE